MTARPVFLFLSAAACTAFAEAPRLSRTFGDDMVLQAGRAIPVWGYGTPGAEVTVSFAGASATAKAGADGRWAAELPAQAPCADGRELRVASAEGGRTLTGVRIGDVYLVMGDRHVGWPFWTVGAQVETDFDRHADTNLCWYIAPLPQRLPYPAEDLDAPTATGGFWRSMRFKSHLGSFPYFWARERAAETKMPVGAIIATGGAYDRCDARMYMRPETYAATTNDLDRPKAFDAQNPTSEKGLARLQAAAAEIRRWADGARALPLGRYPSANMAELPNLERFGQVTSWYNSQVAPFLRTPLKGAVLYAGVGRVLNPREPALAEELKADMRRIWGEGLEFTVVPIPDAAVMKGDCPEECDRPRDVVRALAADSRRGRAER